MNSIEGENRTGGNKPSHFGHDYFGNLEMIPLMFGRSGDTASPETAKEIRQMNDYAFRTIILSRILNHAEDDMRSAGMTEEQIEKIENALAGLGPKVGEAVFSLPAEIREQRYARMAQAMNAGASPEDELEKLILETLVAGKGLGYHITDKEIPKEGSADNWSWSIKGYEYDHRDDMSMAYYSLDHENLFYKRKGKYVYVIRADEGENTVHRMDSNNKWGRAPRLSVIDKFDIAEVNKEVDGVVNEITKMPGKKPLPA